MAYDARQVVELGPFTGGVNLVDSLSKIEPNELVVCKNIRIGLKGNYYKRPGSDKYGTAHDSINGNNLVNLLLRYYKSDGSRKLIGAAGGKLRYGDDVAGTWTPISINDVDANMATTFLCDWMVYKDRLYISDGTAVQRYNGTHNLYAGGFTHVAPTLAEASGGSIEAGTYKYFVTSVAGNMGEGPQGAIGTIAVTGSGNQINLTGMAAADAKYEETTKKIYRTKADGSVYYFIAEIATGTTTYNDTTADSLLSTEYIPAIVPPADSKYCIMGHDERAYWFGSSGANASLVRVSDVGFPDRVINNGTDGFFTVANNDGDILTGAGLVPGGIIFFKKTSCWLSRAFGYGLINIQPREKKGAGLGTVSPHSIVTTPIGLFWLSQQGKVYRFDGTNLDDEVGIKVAPEFLGMTDASLGRVVACFHDNRYIISYDFRGSKGYNWKTLEYDIMGRKWEGPHENSDQYTPSYYSVWDSQIDKGELYFGEGNSANGSKVYGRNQFSKLDKGATKFIGTMRTGRVRNAGSGKLRTVKAYVDADVSGDTYLELSHINQSGDSDKVTLNISVPFEAHRLGPLPASQLAFQFVLGPGGSKLGGNKSDILEGSFGANARGALPQYELTDGGTSIEIGVNSIRLSVVGFPNV